MLFDGLLHLDLLLVSLLLVQFRTQTRQILRLVGGVVGFTSGTLSGTLLMIQAATMLLGEAFHIFILRHCGGGIGAIAWRCCCEV